MPSLPALLKTELYYFNDDKMNLVCDVLTKKNKCRFKYETAEVIHKGHVLSLRETESSLKDIVARVGPVSVAIYANGTYFKEYTNG